MKNASEGSFKGYATEANEAAAIIVSSTDYANSFQWEKHNRLEEKNKGLCRNSRWWIKGLESTAAAVTNSFPAIDKGGLA